MPWRLLSAPGLPPDEGGEVLLGQDARVDEVPGHHGKVVHVKSVVVVVLDGVIPSKCTVAK